MRRALRLSLAAYAALLVAPVATLAVGPTWSALTAGALLGGALGYAATATVDYHHGLQSVSVALAGFVLPLGWLRPAFSGADSVPSLFLSPWFAGCLAVVPWFAAVLIAYEQRTRDRIDELTERVVFRARKPPEERRQMKIAAGAIVAMTVIVAVAGFALGSGDLDFATWFFPALLPGWIVMLSDSNEREVAVAEEGLRVERQVHDWTTVEGYEVTDDALTLARPKWYHSDLSFDRSDIEDLDAVTAALDDVLTRS